MKTLVKNIEKRVFKAVQEKAQADYNQFGQLLTAVETRIQENGFTIDITCFISYKWEQTKTKAVYRVSSIGYNFEIEGMTGRINGYINPDNPEQKHMKSITVKL